MENLSLKHISPYLPYNLTCHCMGLQIDDSVDEPLPLKVEIIGANTSFVEIHEIGRTVSEQYEYSEIFPLLKPLSNLKDQLTHFRNGETIQHVIDYPNDYLELQYITKKEFDYLAENHYDIFGLIQRGLAVSY